EETGEGPRLALTQLPRSGYWRRLRPGVRRLTLKTALALSSFINISHQRGHMMKRSINRILTTHAGSLSRPNDLIDLYRENAPPGILEPRLKSAVAEVVRQQADVGIDVVNDGEFSKATRAAVDYGAW